MLSSLIHLKHVFGFGEDNSWRYYFPHVATCSSFCCNRFPQSCEISLLYHMLMFPCKHGSLSGLYCVVLIYFST